MIVGDRNREDSVFAFHILEFIAHDLVKERSVGEIRPNDKRLMRNVGGSGVSHTPLVAVDELRSIRKKVMGEEEPLFPSGTVLEGVFLVVVDLGPVGGAGIHIVGERNGVAS